MTAFSRRQALSLFAGAGITSAIAQPAFAMAPDYAAFNRNYVTHIVMPRLTRLREACGTWQRKIDAILVKPSAAKIDAIMTDLDQVSELWIEVEPFRYLPSNRLTGQDRLARWTVETDRLAAELKRLIESDDRAELMSARFSDSVVARHGLAAATRLQFDDNGDSNVIRDFYLDARADRRCAILRAVVAHLHSVVTDAEAEWKAALADNGASFSISARETAGAFLSDQVNMLKTVAMRKMALPLGPTTDAADPKRAEQWQLDQFVAISIGGGPPIWQSGRAAKYIALNLGAVRHALVSRFGLVNLLPPDAALTATLEEMTASLVVWTSNGMRIPAYSGMIYPMCCFSPCPDPDLVKAENAERIRLQRNLAIVMMVKVNELRMLLQRDVATAVGLTDNLRELETDEL